MLPDRRSWRGQRERTGHRAAWCPGTRVSGMTARVPIGLCEAWSQVSVHEPALVRRDEHRRIVATKDVTSGNPAREVTMLRVGQRCRVARKI